jgi:hypothetical protein
MASGKRKTTMAKLNRERMLRERRVEKQVKKNLRKRAAADRVNEQAEVPTDEVPAGDEEPGAASATD